MTYHHISDRLLDLATFLAAGVAIVSLTQAALVMSLLAAFISVICGGIRIYDRCKYGPGGKQ